MQTPELLSLKEMQQVYLELLKEFDELCRHHGLRYDLAGGSLLGAVRHGGFIPWDDDIDVCMPRPDYLRLLELKAQGKLKLSQERDVISHRDQTFARHFGRYVRHDVRRLSDMAEDNDCPYIGMDIFPIDGLPEGDLAFKWQCFRIRQLRRFLLTSVEKKGTSRKGAAAAKIKDLYRPLLKKIGPYRIAARLDRVCSRVPFDKASLVGAVTGMYGARERWSKERMLPQKRMKFEDTEACVFENYDIYLSNLFGDYMRLPPVEQQVPHCDSGYRVKETQL
jgi:lipopolysaccharide cholinephosphotransferase